MSWSVVYYVVYAVVTVASVAYSIQQAKKAKEAARKAADARKGFEIPVEGQAINLPICYGRVLIGGARVYHNTAGNFKYVTPNGDKSFLSGADAAAITVNYKNRYGVAVSSTQGSNTRLDSNKSGNKNQFLFFQQALCLGPINQIIDVVIDDSKYMDDPGLGTDIYTNGLYNFIAGGLRIDCHYQGGVADSIMSANFGERSKAVFDDMAYISVVAALDRENPQFAGTPQVQCLIEGRKVRTVTAGVINNTRVYSTNPAWCLLDYLTDTVSGKALSEDELDLPSFEAAAAICDLIVQQDVQIGGKIWQPTFGTRYYTRDLPLYECNLILDTNKTIRQNVETILASMGDARLIWSAGKYKLSLQYPDCNEIPVPNPLGKSRPIILAATLTDADLVMDQTVDIAWPSASERLNHCIVKFSNEAENFKEDSASWPPKLGPDPMTDTRIVGLGSFRYPPGSSHQGWDVSNPNAYIMNNFAVWSGSGYTTNLQYLVIIEKENAGSCLISFGADDSGSYILKDYLTNVTVASGSVPDFKTKHTTTVTLGDSLVDKVYVLEITATDTSDSTPTDDGSKTKGRGAALLIEKGNYNIWNTRSTNYTSFTTRTVNNYIYRGDPGILGDTGLLGEDNGMELETEVYAEGISDYYHALAKAEELVRTSRGAYGLKIKYIIKNIILEPGDFIKIDSETLKIGNTSNLYFRVNSVKMESEFLATLELTRFDYTFLAWNVKDDVYISPPPIYDMVVPAPNWLRYENTSVNNLFKSSGTLYWAEVSYQDLGNYILYMAVQSDGFDTYGRPIFREIGRTPNTFFVLPALTASAAWFGVRTVSKNGALSNMTLTNTKVGATLNETDILEVPISQPWQEEDLILDPTFSLATDNRYWMWSLEDDPQVEILPTGGVNGGVLRLTGSGTEAILSVYTNRDPMPTVVTGEQIVLNLRFRVTSAINSEATLSAFALTTAAGWPTSSNQRTTPQEIYLLNLNSYPLNEWQEKNVVVTMNNVSKSLTQLPFIAFSIDMLAFINGTVEIDTFRAVRSKLPPIVGTDGNTQGSVELPQNKVGDVLDDNGNWVSLAHKIHERPTLAIRPSDLTANNSFGISSKLSKDGSTLAVLDTNGKLYIYSGINFEKEVTKTSPTIVNGTHLAISDDGVAIFVANNNGDFSILRNRDNNDWSTSASFNLWDDILFVAPYSSVFPLSNMGSNIAISGNGRVLAIGLIEADSAQGRVVLMYDYNMTENNLEPKTIYPPTVTGPFNAYAKNFGWSVALDYSGENLLVGMLSQFPITSLSQYCWAFIYNGVNWSNVTQLNLPAPSLVAANEYLVDNPGYYGKYSGLPKVFLSSNGNRAAIVDKDYKTYRNLNSNLFCEDAAVFIFDKNKNWLNPSLIERRNVNIYDEVDVTLNSDFSIIHMSGTIGPNWTTEYTLLHGKDWEYEENIRLNDLFKGTLNEPAYDYLTCTGEGNVIGISFLNDSSKLTSAGGVYLLNVDIWSNKPLPKSILEVVSETEQLIVKT